VRALITGGNGFIGRHLAVELDARGHDVMVGDLEAKFWPVGGSCGVLDVCNPDSLLPAFRQFKPEVVFHLAAQGDVGQSFARPVHTIDLNVTATARVWDACVRTGVRKIVFPSTWMVYGPPHTWDTFDGRIQKSSPRRPLTPYGISKNAAGELLLSLTLWSSGPQAAVLYLGNVYGPGGSNIVQDLLAARRLGQTFRLLESWRDFVHVTDVVGAMIAAAEFDGSLDVHVATGVATAVSEVALMLGAPFEMKAAEPLDGRVALDVRAAEQMLDWKPQISLEAGLAALTAAR